jgi:hypothetical protein
MKSSRRPLNTSVDQAGPLGRKRMQSRTKIRVLSDLHLEFQDWVPPKSDADIVVLAGDIHVGVHGIEWARRRFPLTPVVYVPGNHEYYGGSLQAVREELYARGKCLGVDVLDGRKSVIGGVRFLGATLWTDFALYGSDQGSISRRRYHYGSMDTRTSRSTIR